MSRASRTLTTASAVGHPSLRRARPPGLVAASCEQGQRALDDRWNETFRNLARIAVLALLMVPLSGCLGIGGAPRLAVIGHDADALPVTTRVEPLPQQLLVALPQAPELLASRRVLTRTTQGELALLADVAWPEPLPGVLQDALVEALQRVPFRAVDRVGGGLRGDLVLDVSLHRMELDYREQRAIVEFEALLLTRGGKAVASRRFRDSAVAPRAPREAATALLALSRALLAQAVDWVAQEAQRSAGTSG